MKRKLFAILLTVAMVMTSVVIAIPAAAEAGVDPTPGVGTSYYYDSVNGNDNNNGLSPDSPKKDPGTQIWPGAGDTYFFAYGSSYNHGLEIIGSGTEAAPITITAYGDPDKGLPTFNGTAHTDVREWQDGGAAIKITKQSYITIENLKLTHYNPANEDDWKTGYYRRSGVWVIAQEGSVVKGITLRGLEIEKIMGMSITKESDHNNITLVPNGIWVSQASNAAIQLDQWDWTNQRARFDGILVEDCYIHDINTVAISVHGYDNGLATNVTIRNNTINGIGADAIVVGATDSVLVENNVVYNVNNPAHGSLEDFHWTGGIWVWACSGTNVIQNNEVAYTKGMADVNETDSAAFDTDIWSKGDYYWQYNYTHDNDGGFYFSMNSMWEHDPDGMNYIRYNVSVNDKRQNNSGSQLNLKDPTVLANNVFYNDIGGNNKIQINISEEKVTFVNNVFYQANADADDNVFAWEPGDTFKFFNNAIYGSASLPKADDGSNLLITNPDELGFEQVGIATSETREAVTAGYKLTEGSRLINAGKNTVGLIPEVDGVTNRGIQMQNGRRDYFGNEFGSTGLPDIGIHETNTVEEGVVAPNAPTDLAAPIITDESVSLTWNAKDEDGSLMDAWVYRDGEAIAYVTAANSYTDTGLKDETEYVYKVAAVNKAGVSSAFTEELPVKTAIAAIIINVNDTAADNDGHYPSSTGSWQSAGGAGSYEDTYMVSEDPDAAFTWNIDINTPGYYNVYYWQPNGNQLRTRNAIYTVNHADGASTFSVDQRNSGGQWVLVSSYRYEDGQYAITLENGDSGLLNAGAVRLVYAGEAQVIGTINKVEMQAATTMLKVGENTAASIIVTDTLGRSFDVSTIDGAAVSYSVSDDSVITVENGVITAVGEGASELSATVNIGGDEYKLDPILIQVGDDLAIAEPKTAEDGNTMTITVPVSNFTGKDKQVTVIAVVYDADERMLDYEVSEKVTLRTMNAKTFTVTVDTTAAATVELYVWDTIEGMHPITQIFTLK